MKIREYVKGFWKRVKADPAFRAALLTEAVELFLSGDVPTGKAVLRNYINATVGFEGLAGEIGTPSKSLMRMFGAKGNPRADNLFSVIGRLQQMTGVQLAVHSQTVERFTSR